MKIFSISDLHLSFSQDKPMDVFGDHWKQHYEKIEKDWKNKVSNDDIVVVAGDISWAIDEKGAHKDLLWIDNLPGKKIFVKGNHDYWWKSLKRLNEKYDSIDFIQNNAYVYNNIAFCGTRGWIIPGAEDFEESDLKIYRREVMRLDRSIKMAKALEGVEHIIAITHYPPITKQFLKTEFNDVLISHDIKTIIYGHLHDENSWNNTIIGLHEGIHYYLTSCDYLGFKLIEIEI